MNSNIIISSVTDAFQNLALESLLFNTAKEDTCYMYLWQNYNSVIIGKNQNPWKECNVSELVLDKITLARRSTGGGAVYHDLGNLNFSFVFPKKQYDLTNQLNIIINTLKTFNLNAEFSGRNDILIDGAKFSGNAFLHNSKFSLHHGTLLVKSDFSMLKKYLTPSKLKIQSKGIKSVVSRVCNLSDFNSDITIKTLMDELIKQWQLYFGESTIIDAQEFISQHQDEYKPLYETQSSWEWNHGKTPTFDVLLQDKFSWGEVDLYLTIKNSCIQKLQVYSDSLDTNISDEIEKFLVNKNINEISTNLPDNYNEQYKPIFLDIITLFSRQFDSEKD